MTPHELHALVAKLRLLGVTSSGTVGSGTVRENEMQNAALGIKRNDWFKFLYFSEENG